MLQQKNPEDYVIATGEARSIREFVEESVKQLGINFRWSGKGVNEKGINKDNNEAIIEIDPRYFRPTEVDRLLGDSTRARKELGWEPQVEFKGLIQMMVQADLVHYQKK